MLVLTEQGPVNSVLSLFPMRLMVKRDGSTVAFDASKITRAVALAFRDAKRAGIGVNCEAPSFGKFVSWLRQNESDSSLGDKEVRFSGILQDTFNGEKVPSAQQMRRLCRGLAAAGIAPEENGLLKIFAAAQACAQRAAVNPMDDPQRKALAEFPYGLSPQWWSEVAQISGAIVKQIADHKSNTTTVEEAQDLVEEAISRAGHLTLRKATSFIAAIARRRGRSVTVMQGKERSRTWFRSANMLVLTRPRNGGRHGRKVSATGCCPCTCAVTRARASMMT
jgi:hypothetical protein